MEAEGKREKAEKFKVTDLVFRATQDEILLIQITVCSGIEAR